jgi:hypothetical protein
LIVVLIDTSFEPVFLIYLSQVPPAKLQRGS